MFQCGLLFSLLFPLSPLFFSVPCDANIHRIFTLANFQSHQSSRGFKSFPSIISERQSRNATTTDSSCLIWIVRAFDSRSPRTVLFHSFKTFKKEYLLFIVEHSSASLDRLSCLSFSIFFCLPFFFPSSFSFKFQKKKMKKETNKFSREQNPTHKVLTSVVFLVRLQI